jgi:hypothetical protein
MLKREWMQWVAVLALGLSCAVPSFAADTPASLAGVKLVTADEAKKLQDSGVPLIDTRFAAEYAEKTIKGAKSVP